MKKKNFIKVLTSFIAVFLILVSCIVPALAVEHDPYLGMEYDYSEKGVIDLEVGDDYLYGGAWHMAGYCHSHYYWINGRTAYCCWTNMDSPVTQTETKTKYFIGNHAARAKALYYFGYASSATPTARNERIASGMPTTFLGKNITYYKDYVQAVTDYARTHHKIDGEFDYNDHSDDVMAYIVTHLALDDMMNGGNGIQIADGNHAIYPSSDLVYATEKFVDDILYNSSVMSKVPSVPSAYRVFYCFPDRENGRNTESQGLMSIEGTPTGSFLIDKRSTNVEITSKNSCYSYKDAEFNICKNSDATGVIKTVVTDKDGYAEVTGLTPGAYYIKETKAPKGYMVSPEIFKITVKTGDKPSDNIIKIYDQPYNDPARIMVFKNDPDHIEKDDNGNDVKKGLEGVEFEIKYYDADPETTVSLSDLGDKEPKRTWKIKTDEDGYAALGNSWKVGGDEFYYLGDTQTVVVPIGCLTLQETKSAPGYVLDPTVRFARVTQSMAENNEIIKFSDTALTNDSVDYPNHQTTTEISKKSITTQDELPGARLRVMDKNGTIVDVWTSTNEPHIIKGLTVGETYTLTETITPDTYVTASSIQFTVNADGVTHVEMIDDITKYEFIKVDEYGKPLRGAKMRVEEVSDSADKYVNEWVTDGTVHKIYGELIVGRTYKFSEIEAPKGYPLAEPETFTVTDDGDIHTLTATNVLTETHISKKSITTQEELPGAQLVVKDKDGNIVDEWTSGNEEHIIRGLEPGETYTLTETISPDGYVISTDIEFTVNDDGTVTHVEMIDDTTKFKFIKVDDKGNPVAGAKLRIEVFKGVSAVDGATPDEINETEVWEPVEGEEWITDAEGTPHEVNGKLTVGQRYRLVEVEAPKGYNLAAPIEFTVENNAEPVEITMVNTTTTITKTDITGEKEIPGAKLIIRDKDGNIVAEITSGTDPSTIDGLIEGETYTLEEIIPAPGYVTAEPITFTVTKNGISTNVTMKDAPTKIVIRKLDDSNKPVSGAKLQILDKDGNVIEEWTTDGKDHLIEAKLVVGETYTLHEVSAPDGYELAKDITFTVKDTADEQEVTMIDVYKGDAKISTPDQPTKSAASQNGGGGGSSVRTGQGTVGLMIALAVIMISAAFIVYYRKKRKVEDPTT